LVANGTKRTFAAPQHFVRYWGKSGHWAGHLIAHSPGAAALAPQPRAE
jgi:hypothetical protein